MRRTCPSKLHLLSRASILCRMHKFLRNNNESALQKLLSPSSTRPGVTTLLTSEEEDMIAERMIFAAKRGLPVWKDYSKSVTTQITSDGRQNWKQGSPSDAEFLNWFTLSPFFKTAILRRFLFTAFLFLCKDLHISKYMNLKGIDRRYKCIWLIKFSIQLFLFSGYWMFWKVFHNEPLRKGRLFTVNLVPRARLAINFVEM